MTDIDIYKQTQEIALIILTGQGYVLDGGADKSVINHLSRNPRVTTVFATAVELQERLFNHEMSDVIDSYEEHLIDCCHDDANLTDAGRDMSILHLEANIMNKAFDDIAAMKSKHKFN